MYPRAISWIPIEPTLNGKMVVLMCMQERVSEKLGIAEFELDQCREFEETMAEFEEELIAAEDEFSRVSIELYNLDHALNNLTRKY